MADNHSNNSEQQLNANSVSKFDVTIMGISGAAPVMCIAASMGDIMSLSGTAAALAFILATIVLVMVGSSFGRLSERFNSAGGAYAYVRDTFGSKLGFVTAYLFFGNMICTGIIGGVFSSYLNDLTGLPKFVCVIILLLPVFFLGWRGVEFSTKALVAIWFVQMALIIYPAIRVWTIRAAEVENILANSAHAFVPSFGITNLMFAVLVCVWCFVGFEGAAYMGEEIKGGAKSVKFAITASVIGIGAVYAVTCWLWTAGMTNVTADLINEWNANGMLLADYAKMIGYAAGRPLIACATLASCVGCFICFATIAPRGFFDMGRNGYLPEAFGKLNKHQSPHISLIFYSVFWFAASLYASYGNISHLFNFMAVFSTATYILVCIAHLKDRAKDGNIFIDKIVPAAAIAIMVYMIISSDMTTKLGLVIYIAVITIAGFIWDHARSRKVH